MQMEYGEQCNGLQFKEEADLLIPDNCSLTLKLIDAADEFTIIYNGRILDSMQSDIDLPLSGYNYLKLRAAYVSPSWRYNWILTIRNALNEAIWTEQFGVHCNIGVIHRDNVALDWRCLIQTSSKYDRPRYRDGDRSYNLGRYSR